MKSRRASENSPQNGVKRLTSRYGPPLESNHHGDHVVVSPVARFSIIVFNLLRSFKNDAMNKLNSISALGASLEPVSGRPQTARALGVESIGGVRRPEPRSVCRCDLGLFTSLSRHHNNQLGRFQSEQEREKIYLVGPRSGRHAACQRAPPAASRLPFLSRNQKLGDGGE